MKVQRMVRISGMASVLVLAGQVAVSQSPGQPVTAQPAGHRAEIEYSQGLLKITADDSSLNKILMEVAVRTGVKVTGQVKDERVYGSYGPGTPAKVLASLLDGTGSNLLFVETASSGSGELILTARKGGPTPPQPAPPAPPPPPVASFPPHASPVPAPPQAASVTGSPTPGTGAGTDPAVGLAGGVQAGAPTPAAQTPVLPTQQENYDRLQTLQQMQRQAAGH
jgi:hypothetical protein